MSNKFEDELFEPKSELLLRNKPVTSLISPNLKMGGNIDIDAFFEKSGENNKIEKKSEDQIMLSTIDKHDNDYIISQRKQKLQPINLNLTGNYDSHEGSIF